MIKDNSIRYQTLSIHFDRLNIVNRFESNRGSRKQIINNDEDNNIDHTSPPKVIKYTVDNKLSVATRNKISKSIRYLNYVTLNKKVDDHHTRKSINFKIAFITLTLSSPQIHSDNEIKNKLLNHLFIELKNKYKVNNYVWRCEKQLNGNVHFHILVDNFIPHGELREIWNRLQNKLGYIDRYTEKMNNIKFKDYAKLFHTKSKYTIEQIRKAYAKGKSTSWKFPNSTDIHSLQFINDIDSYLCKYMSKDEQNKDIEGRLWGCSQSLSNIKGGVAIVDTNISAELTKLYSTGKARFFTGDYYTIAFVDIMFLKYIGCNLLFELYREFLINHFKLESS
jgi:hypothetical protein